MSDPGQKGGCLGSVLWSGVRLVPEERDEGVVEPPPTARGGTGRAAGDAAHPMAAEHVVIEVSTVTERHHLGLLPTGNA